MTPCAQRLFKSHVSMNTSSVRKVACHCYLRVVLCFYLCAFVFLSNCDAMTKRESQICILKVKNSSFALFPCGFFICVHFVRWIVFFRWVHDVSTCRQLFNFFSSNFQTTGINFFFLDSWYTFVRARRLEMNDKWLQKGEVLFSDVVVVVVYPVCAGLSKNKTWGSTIFKTHPRVRENLH